MTNRVASLPALGVSLVVNLSMLIPLNFVLMSAESSEPVAEITSLVDEAGQEELSFESLVPTSNSAEREMARAKQQDSPVEQPWPPRTSRPPAPRLKNALKPSSSLTLRGSQRRSRCRRSPG